MMSIRNAAKVASSVTAIAVGAFLLYLTPGFYVGSYYDGVRAEWALLKYVLWIDRSGDYLRENIETYANDRWPEILTAIIFLGVGAWLLWWGLSSLLRQWRKRSVDAESD